MTSDQEKLCSQRPVWALQGVLSISGTITRPLKGFNRVKEFLGRANLL
jgi:hypothetical protein